MWILWIAFSFTSIVSGRCWRDVEGGRSWAFSFWFAPRQLLQLYAPPPVSPLAPAAWIPSLRVHLSPNTAAAVSIYLSISLSDKFVAEWFQGSNCPWEAFPGILEGGFLVDAPCNLSWTTDVKKCLLHLWHFHTLSVGKGDRVGKVTQSSHWVIYNFVSRVILKSNSVRIFLKRRHKG